IRAAMRIPSVGRLFLMQMATYSSFVIFAGLWGGPYLTHVYGYDLKARGALLLVPAVAQIVGLMLYGWSDRVFGSYHTPIAIGAFVTAGSSPCSRSPACWRSARCSSGWPASAPSPGSPRW